MAEISDGSGIAKPTPKDFSQPKEGSPKEIFETRLKPINTQIAQISSFTSFLDRYATGLNESYVQANQDGSIHKIRGGTVDDVQGGTYGWFKDQIGASIDDRIKKLPPEKQTQAIEVIERQMREWVDIRGAKMKPQERTKKMNELKKELATTILGDSEDDQYIKQIVEAGSEGKTITQVLEEQRTLLEVEAEILRLDPQVTDYEVQAWVSAMSNEMLIGFGDGTKRKVFDTPHYKGILEKLHQIGRKVNGVGGAILYGPPGTGKTELLKEKNRQEGFDTHVISIHHYTSFGELLGERAVGVSFGAELGSGLSSNLSTIAEHLRSDRVNPDQFKQIVEGLFSTLQAEGKVGRHVTVGQLLLPHIDVAQNPEIVDLIAQDTKLSTEEWGKIQQAYLTKLSSRILRASFGKEQQEEVVNIDDVVRGEILLAIKRSKQGDKKIRVVLDEIDKAGPNALGGLLGFLARSPGEEIRIGSVAEEIPSWFRVDATSNSETLDEFLLDRFTQLEIQTPPQRDQMAIATVRLSDNAGNVLLSKYEQEQMVAFFAFAVPQINRMLTKYNKAPISIRGIQEVSAKLVDLKTATRTGVSVGSAIRSYLRESRAYMGDHSAELRAQMEKFINANLADMLKGEEQTIGLKASDTAHSSDDEADVNNPLMHAISHMHSPRATEDVSFSVVGLTEEQQRVVQEKLHEGQVPSHTPFIQTASGLYVRGINGGVSYMFLSPDSPQHSMWGVNLKSNNLDDIKGILGVNEMGDRLLVTDLQGNVSIVNMTNSSDKVVKLVGQTKDTEYVWNAATGNFTIIKKDKPNSISVMNSQGDNITEVEGEACSFSPDGSMLMVRNGTQHYLLNISTRSIVARLPESTADKERSWEFVGGNLIVDRNNISEGAVYYS